MAERMLAGAGALPSGAAGASLYTVEVQLRPDILHEGGYRAELEDGTLLHPETLKRLACDAGLVPVLVDGRGTPMDMGRKRRLVTAALRRALIARDGACCAFPGCTSTRFLHAHHMEHWSEGGETRLDKLLMLCSRHHQLVHEQGYGVTLGDEGRPQFVRPDGEPLLASPDRPAAPGDPLGAFATQHALFKTMKYVPEYPKGAFASLTAAIAWVTRFVAWYNHQHLHSGIGFVTPADRHHGRSDDIFAHRRRVYERAKRRHPERWSGATRNWSAETIVVLNPTKETRIEMRDHATAA